MTTATTDTAALVEQLTDLPAQQTTALRVISLLDDPDSSASDLARLIETDPALSARVMHLANSPFYGLQRQVASALRAITVLGFSTVRALAAVAASGVFAEGGSPLPKGFWAHSVAVAAGSSVIARHGDVASAEAFTSGLLHDLGIALLAGHNPKAAGIVDAAASADPSVRVDVERHHFGMGHDAVGAAVLDAWGFPPVVTEVLRDHHGEGPALRPVAAAVRAGEALAAACELGPFHEASADLGTALAGAGIDADPDVLQAETVAEMESLAAFLAL